DNPAIAAMRIADGAWLDESLKPLGDLGEAWTRRFCDPAKPRRWRRPNDKLIIGYLVPRLADPGDAGFVAAVARAHDRRHATVVAYGNGAQSWEENLPFQGAFDTWQDISTLDPATLARFFERDGLHLIVDASGFHAPDCLLALAHTQTA